MISGCFSRISRIFLVTTVPASSDIVDGIAALIQKLPSSSAGKNSLPSRDAAATLNARKTHPTITATLRAPAQRAHDDRFGLLDMPGKQQCRENRRHRERRQQRTGQGVAIGARHRPEDLSFDALHREQRHECSHRDSRCEKHRLVDLQRADEDDPQPLRPTLARGSMAMHRCRIIAPIAFSEMLKQRLPLLVGGLKVAKDILHHDHGGIDDDPEIDGAERQQVRILALKHEDDDGKEQRERDVGADDDGAPEIAQEYPLDEKYQQAAENEIMQNRMRSHPDQRTAIVIRDDLDPGRQAAIGVEFFDLGLNPRNDIVGVLGSPHHHDGGCNIVVVISPPDSKPRNIADGNGCNVLDLDRKTVRLGQDNVLDVLDLVTLGDVVGAAAIDQSDTAYVDRLLPDRDLPAADIDIGIAERGDQLRDRDVVGFQCRPRH
jgi:hypothetical protein